MVQAWLIRAGREDEYEQEAFAEGVVALGWKRVGDLTAHRTIAAVGSAVNGAYAEYTTRSRKEFGVQLFAFRSRVRPGDFVVLLRSNAPDVAVGIVTGEYTFRAELPGPHVRSVRWERTDVRRTEIGADLLSAPALSNIYKINREGAERRLADVVSPEAMSTPRSMQSPPDMPPIADAPDLVAAQAPAAPLVALHNLRRNLDYSMSLATAGHHLQQLKVELFEVSDVFRAAWVQAVAALDHWVHQEIHARMLVLAESTVGGRPKQFQSFALPIELVDQIAAGKLTVRQAVDQHFDKVFAFKTFQNPQKIREGLAYVASVGDLWPRVAAVLTERSGGGDTLTSEKVQSQLKEIVVRRNKIAHEYDEDPANAPLKRPIDTATTTQAISFIGKLAEAIGAVLDGG